MVNKKIATIKKQVIPILKKNDVVKAGIFGSVARGEDKKKSDVDILIKFKGENKSLIDLVRLKYELEEKLKRKVDILTYRSINHLIKDQILKEEVRIL
ncbi:nucleotidyltransferase family protein [Candidatus Woesearchaeota archaeon]|nr:nucleotidyltransferase family protein [Candidatus Woesearchaeota archaeon]